MVIIEKLSSQEGPRGDQNSMASPHIDLSEGEGVALSETAEFWPPKAMDQPRSIVCFLGGCAKVMALHAELCVWPHS